MINRFELLVQSVTDYAIYMLDPTGVITSWNAGAERFKGYAPDEIIGQHFSKFYTEEDLQRGIPATGLRTAEAEGRFEAEGWRLRKDGTRFWANVVIDPIWDPSGELVGFAKVTRDLTVRREAEEELRRSEERFRFLLQSVTDYAIYMLDTEGHVTSWNAGAERFKGYTAEEIIGQHFSRFYAAEDQAAGVPARALRTALDEGRFEAEGWRYRKDGTQFWANVVIDPVRNDSGTLIGFAKITRDLTERRGSQLALEQAQQAFFQSQKMEAIGKLTGGVAHDFNNLLAAIIGSVDLARRRLAKGEDISRFLDNIMQAAERGATLTHRMLAFARKQELELQSVRLPDLVRGMADLLQRTIGPGIAIDTRFPLLLKPVRADPGQLELALLNLAVNARDAMPNGGVITIGARHETVQVRNGLTPGDYICLWVSDEGEGMDTETLGKAVDPFFTTKGVGRGTGLGLSMVAGMAEQCGGKLVLSSEAGHGAVVEIWLPVAAADAHSPEVAAPQTPDRRVLDPLTILIVDDDEIVLTNTAAMLSDMGHTVLQAPSAAEGLRILGKSRVDLLITDFAMPEMTGADLIHAVEGGWPRLPILLVSGYAEIPEGAAVGIPRLAKPFRPHQLTAAILDMMRETGSSKVLSFTGRS
ncbi:MAG TPA: PAS domain S-box protein [Brevundimonas sp.]|uniref:hybrid sensor histidine kinase/response regulator n=1 Tax=Brevundimonas sp. TaxID=1871086 RepID=UPI002ED9757C